MTFVGEFISSRDVAAYDLASIDKKFVLGGTNARDWVIDRERGIYLRNVASGGGSEFEVRNQTRWTFYWRGALVELRLDMLDSGGEKDGFGWSNWRLIWINGGRGLSAELKADGASFIVDLVAALSAHKGLGGAYSKYEQYEAKIEVAEGCVI